VNAKKNLQISLKEISCGLKFTFTTSACPVVSEQTSR
jgi:hypothetical protein